MRMLWFALGALFVLLLNESAQIAVDLHQEAVFEKYEGTLPEKFEKYNKEYPTASKVNYFLISPSIGLWLPLTERCTLQLRKDQPRRSYFECNRAQVFISDLIYGERKDKK